MIFDTSHFSNLTADLQFPGKIIALDSVPSTNQWLKECDEDCFEHGITVIADHQTLGRGQHQRAWISEPGVNITCSLGLIPHSNRPIHSLIHLTGLSIAEALQSQFSSQNIQIKWPNDIILNGKKAGGILTETAFQGNNLRRVIIGFGLNVNQRTMPAELERIATSLLLETGMVISREELLNRIFVHFNKNYQQWERENAGWQEIFNQFLIGMNKRCRCVIATGKNETKKVNGLCRGLQPDGTLKIVPENEEPMTFSHEEIRIYPLES